MKKIDRIKVLQECLDKIIELKEQYTPVSPGWILINTAQGHIGSLHHLESDTNFNDDTLGIKK